MTGRMDGSMTTDRDHADAASLEAFFAAARKETVAPRLELMNAILADAAGLDAERAAAAPRVSRAAPKPKDLGVRLAGLFAGLGGWRVAAALIVCTAIGFGAGLSGSVSLSNDFGIYDTASYDDTATGVTALYDLALAEG